MIVRVALVAVRRAMLVAMVVRVVIMPAAAIVAMGMGVGVGMSLGMAVRMGVMMAGMIMSVMGVIVMGIIVMGMAAVIMTSMIVAWMIAIGMIVVVSPTLGLERPFDHRHRTALPTHHLGEDMVVLDVERVGRDLGRGVAVADMPGDAHQPQRVVGADLQQALGRRPDQDEPAILQLDRVAVVERGRLVEIEQDIEAGVALQRQTPAAAILMVERQGLDDAVRLDRGFANDGGGAQHDGATRMSVIRGDRLIAARSLRSPEAA